MEISKVHTFEGHKDCVYSITGQKEGDLFFSAGADGMIVQWDTSLLESGKLVAQITKSVYAMMYDAENNYLVVGENREGIHVISLDNKKEVGSLKLNCGLIFDIKRFENHLFVACDKGELWLVDYERLTVLKKIQISDQNLRSLLLLEDKGCLAVGGSDAKIKILDLKHLEVLKEITAHENSVFSIQRNPQNGHLVSVSRDAHVKAFDPNNDFEEAKSIVGHTYAINKIVFSPEGSLFATGSMDKVVKIWDAKSYKLLKVIDKTRYEGHNSSVNTLYWPSKAGYLISGSDDRAISAWKIRN